MLLISHKQLIFDFIPIFEILPSFPLFVAILIIFEVKIQSIRVKTGCLLVFSIEKISSKVSSIVILFNSMIL